MAKPKKTITFTTSVEVLDHNKKVEFSAVAGEVRELSTASANRWLRRNVAVSGIVGSSKIEGSVEEKVEEPVKEQSVEDDDKEEEEDAVPKKKKTRTVKRRASSDNT